jgi:uncharacterized membrane protein
MNTTLDNLESQGSYLVQPLPLYFLLGLILVNVIAIFQWDPFYIGSLFAFLYIVITPGFLILPFFTSKKLAPMLGIAFSVALSILILMLVGLGLNTALPYFGMHQPLATVPLLVAFDVVIYLLLTFNFLYKKNSPFEFHEFNALSWALAGASLALPVLACLGAIVLNNGGPDVLTMIALAIIGILVPIIVFINKDKISPSIPPLSLYMMALSFLLMNSMRGWFITGHDILLEYHVFSLVYVAQHWSMSLYQDPYMACLSLTILPTYLENLLHVNPAYIYKFFTQFLGALPVVLIYYLAKEYVSEKVAFLSGFLYITFPTFLVDMAFLNRQGIAFIFFGSMLFVLLTTEYFSGWKRHFILILFGIGVILSHYSTSYVAAAVLIGAYIINRILRLLIKIKKPQWLGNLISRIGNKEMYKKPILLRLPFVILFFALLFLWSSVITKTSTSLDTTVQQIVSSIDNLSFFSGATGPAKYGLVASAQPTPQELFNQFLQDGIQQENVSQHVSEFYPTAITDSYSTTAVAEMPATLTPFGSELQTIVRFDLWDLYNDIKQAYAKVLQVLLLIGIIGLIFGYSFKENILRNVPIEYIALSISGIGVLVGQTILPASAVDYGLLRLFQQNLIFLALPIMLGFLCVIGLITRNHKKQLLFCTGILLFFYVILSGFFPQFTGGGRAPLPLDNNGLYYNSYYTHAQEVYSADWLAKNGNLNLPVQAAHFSDIKMIAYGHIGSYIELLPQTTKREAYDYLNYYNVTTSNIIEIINGDVVYYHFPLDFLANNKNLIYNNGGSEIYR